MYHFHRNVLDVIKERREKREKREREKREMLNSISQEFSYGAFGEDAIMQDNDVSLFYDVPGSSSDIYMSD